MKPNGGHVRADTQSLRTASSSAPWSCSGAASSGKAGARPISHTAVA
ncbi:MAG: hypothetical protein Q7K57_29065 [Burkholderiaceae bacterium]|nr:hypothetical protein [Burkholderiaceae bacterium]